MDQRARLVAGCRMHHHAGRFVDDEQIAVLIDDLERDRLGRCNRGISLRNLELDNVSGRDAIRGIGSLAVDPNQAAFDEPRRGGPAQVERILRYEAIEAGRFRRRDYLASGLRSRYPAIRAVTPTVMAESATLKTGKK